MTTELDALARTSARIGSDPLMNQAAGGNTSLKADGLLWVKASGLWLRDATTRPSFVPVHLSVVRAGIADGAVDPVGPALAAALAPAGLRPSIETTLHALMPHPVVLHAHAVDAIAWALMPGAETALADPLAAWRWAWVPYARPGLALTQAVARVIGAHAVDVLVMANHGLVVGAADVASAEALLGAVVERLRRPVRLAPGADGAALEKLAGAGWRVPANTRVHAIATDPTNLRRAQGGVFYPDHVVFLGSALATLPDGLDDAAATAWLAQARARGDAPPCVALPGRGLLVRDDLGEAAIEMLGCLADVLQRLPESPEPVALPPDEVHSLANWEAERFRKQLVR